MDFVLNHSVHLITIDYDLYKFNRNLEDIQNIYPTRYEIFQRYSKVSRAVNAWVIQQRKIKRSDKSTNLFIKKVVALNKLRNEFVLANHEIDFRFQTLHIITVNKSWPNQTVLMAAQSATLLQKIVSLIHMFEEMMYSVIDFLPPDHIAALTAQQQIDFIKRPGRPGKNGGFLPPPGIHKNS